MKRIILLRHGHASSRGTEKSDHSRRLDDRGIRQITVIGKRMITANIYADYLICSDALRAVQSAELIKETLELDLDIQSDPRLYSATPELYAEILKDVPDMYLSVMIVAHNPVMEEVVSLLTSKKRGMGTADLFTAELRIDRWKDFSLSGSTVISEQFISPIET